MTALVVSGGSNLLHDLWPTGGSAHGDGLPVLRTGLVVVFHFGLIFFVQFL